MLPGHLEPTLEYLLGKHLRQATRILKCAPVSGGCIHHATEVKTDQGSFFLKYNLIGELFNFQAESKGLSLLEAAGSFRVPHVLSVNDSGTHAFILMEFLPTAPKARDFWTTFGQGLASQHRITHSKYGLDHDNFIGHLPQSNTRHDDWISFFIHERLEPQLVLAEQKGLAPPEFRPAFESIYRRLPDMIPDEPPSLLHGDLWSGNFLIGPDGEPCIVDPAVYFGHREAEIAFTLLFGGFEQQFYTAYQEAWPLAKGWEERIGLFNLYPLMTGINMFGTGYLPDIQAVLSKFA